MGDIATAPPDPAIQLTREPASIPGDFAAWYQLSVSSEHLDGLGDRLGEVARDLGTVVGAEADDDEVTMLPFDFLPQFTR